MDCVILTGAPAIGKTTVLELLQEMLPEDSAVLDGDNVGRIVPVKVELRWLDLIQDNIIACAANFRRAGIKRFVTAFCMPGVGRLERLRLGLSGIAGTVRFVALCADEPEVVRRSVGRGAAPDDSDSRESVSCNESIRKLPGVIPLDTTSMTARDVAEAVCRIVMQTDATS